jgi:hypothetical protein
MVNVNWLDFLGSIVNSKASCLITIWNGAIQKKGQELLMGKATGTHLLAAVAKTGLGTTSEE